MPNKGIIEQGGAGGNTFLMYDAPMPADYWAKHKKFSVDLNEHAFALDRQLEDQRFLRDNNRNKWNNVLMKCDKTKSEKFGPKGALNPLKVKAKTLNKIVREASGVFDYTLVPPIQKKKKPKKQGEPGSPILDPDMNPYVDVYKRESNMKPKVVTFGHRPRSANQTFHPGTMKFRLKHGQIVQPGKEGRSGFGLSVVQLQQILSAGKVPRADEEGEEENNDDMLNSSNLQRSQYDLSQPSTTESVMTDGIQMTRSDFEIPMSNASGTRASKSGGGDQGAFQTSMNWSTMSASEKSGTSSHQRRKKKKALKKLSSQYQHPVEWNESFHHIYRHPNEKFLTQGSNNEIKEMTMAERLLRFNKNASTIEESSGMCVEKRLLDLTMDKPKPLLSRKEKPKRENQSDPRTTEIVRELERQYQDSIASKDFKCREIRYRDALDTIPTVNYYPDTVNKILESGDMNVYDLSKAQLSPRVKANDKGFDIPTFLEGELSLHGAGSTMSKGTIAKSGDVHANTSFASLAASSINTGPYSESLKVSPPKSLYKPRSESANGFNDPLADLDFKFLDERLLNKSPPTLKEDSTLASNGSINIVKNVTDVDCLMEMVDNDMCEGENHGSPDDEIKMQQ